ncbi:MAG: hypothetical protein ACAI35_10615 [Candidatus Methylacidiphilales bacterium]
MDIAPQINDVQHRFAFVTFLILSGGMLGAIFYYKDSSIMALKDWFPSQRNNIFERAARLNVPDSQSSGTPSRISEYSEAEDYVPTRNKRTSPSESPIATRRSSNDHAA